MVEKFNLFKIKLLLNYTVIESIFEEGETAFIINLLFGIIMDKSSYSLTKMFYSITDEYHFLLDRLQNIPKRCPRVKPRCDAIIHDTCHVL